MAARAEGTGEAEPVNSLFDHDYPFDPSYGYGLDELLAVTAPPAPADFDGFWQARWQRIQSLQPRPVLTHSGSQQGFERFDFSYSSSDRVGIKGWALLPLATPITRVVIIGHGYGGRDAPDGRYQIPGAALLFPCFRGLGRSRGSPFSAQPHFHVLHDLDQRDRYVIGGCVDDLWLAVTAAQQLFPAAADNIGYIGSSFGGGIGALAAPWDTRIKRLHLHVPTFGHQPLRLQLPTTGSGAAVQVFARYHRNVADTLAYFDAATAASRARQPLHLAAALFEPMVAPPGQFAVYNCWAGPKQLLVLDGGHFSYPQQAAQEQGLLHEINRFFAT